MSQAIEIKDFILDRLPGHPHDIVAQTANRFAVSRTTVHRHLTTLIKQHKIVKVGTTRQATYFLTSERQRQYTFTVNKQLSEGAIWEKYLNDLFQLLPKNVHDILHYGFTEIFNNILDHSSAMNAEVILNWSDECIRLTIHDNGIGVFERLIRQFHFENYRECLLHLTKGKLTTDPINHTGEGLFFTSRAFDHFYLMANGLCFYRNNLESDWTLKSIPDHKGTTVTMEISEHSSRILTTIFDQYTDEHFSFNKTDLLADLSQLEGERLISRSQAKRLLMKLEPFKSVRLDFAKVATVGQGFVDEIFRVYVSKHPGVQIQYVNANEDVTFMIKRALVKE